ncbi:MAG: hypothetical protein MJK05_05375 [Nitrosopumilus sp.]|nr:hypothetical protein [Nitrosopumilus sp.]
MNSKEEPAINNPESNSPDTALGVPLVTVWTAESSLLHYTVAPTDTETS